MRDGWAPYRKLPQATHQTCLAHLLRRCHTLLDTAQRGAARFPHDRNFLPPHFADEVEITCI